MADYKADITLNERDSLLDLLNQEKEIMLNYALSISEGCSKGFRSEFERLFLGSCDLQIKVFLLMTELNYSRVKSADENTLNEIKEKYGHMVKALK